MSCGISISNNPALTQIRSVIICNNDVSPGGFGFQAIGGLLVLSGTSVVLYVVKRHQFPFFSEKNNYPLPGCNAASTLCSLIIIKYE